MAITTSILGNLQFRYRGTYSGATAYIIDDVVDFNGTEYVCTQNTTGNSPTANPETKARVTVSGGVFFINGTTNPILNFQRGQKIIFDQDDATNANHVLQFATTSTSQTSNYYTTNVSYFLNNVNVTETVYRNTTTFNAASRRRIEITLDSTAPNTLWYFSNAGGAIYGNSIAITNVLYWKPLRYAFNFRGNHNNTSTLYRVGDVVRVVPRVNNNNQTYMPGQYVDSEAFYICTEEHTSGGTDTSLPQNNTNTNKINNKWNLLESEYDYDDSSFTVRGDILTVTTATAADVLRTAGTYMGVQGTASGSPTDPALFDIIVAPTTGAISLVSVSWGGLGYAEGGTVTINDSVLGAGGAPNVVLNITSVGKYVRGQNAMFTGNHRDCIALANRDGVIGQNERWYRKYGHHNGKNVVDWPCFIDGSGNIKSWGSTSTGQNGVISAQRVATGMTFTFHDWYRSTDNGGTGIHTTPDGQVPKCIQLEAGYSSGMALFNNGEVYHWGYGGHGQQGDSSTSDRAFPVRVGGTYGNVFTALNTSNHTWLNTKIVKIWISNKYSDDTTTHTCYALDDTGGLWAWGYNAYGQIGDNSTSNRSQPTLINKTSYFNGNNIVAFWTAGGAYVHCMALDNAGRLYAWGYNGYGQLGLGDTSQRNVPVEITSPAFTDGGVGKIAKVLKDDHGSYGRTAILTDKGRVYTCGYNGYGWMGNNNTSQLNSLTQIGSGVGSSSSQNCVNMWFTGNGQYHSMFTQGLNGTISAYGRNNNFQLGDGTSTDRSVAVTPNWRIRGTNYVLRDVKCILGHSSNDFHRTHVLTNSGWLFFSGRNNYGCSSMGFSSTYVSDRTNPNGIEESTSAVFQIPRMMNDMQGNIEEVQSFGYGTSNVYFCSEVKTKDNRYMRVGYAGSLMSGHHSNPSETQFQPPQIG